MTILPMRIDISVSESKQQYDLGVNQNRQEYSIDSSEVINVNVVSGPEYEGPYEITPQVYHQFFETKDKLMVDDLMVRQIPYYATTNIQNGITVFIADNINDD